MVGDVFGPAIAALTLGLCARTALARRWAATPPSITPAMSRLPPRPARVGLGILTALGLPARADLRRASPAAVLSIPTAAIDHHRTRDLTAPRRRRPVRRLQHSVQSRPLLVFGCCALLFHLSNAPLLPLVGQKLAAAHKESDRHDVGVHYRRANGDYECVAAPHSYMDLKRSSRNCSSERGYTEHIA